MNWQCVELFSGVGNVSRAFREHGKAVASYDKELGGDCMNIELEAGFLPAPKMVCLICVDIQTFIWMCPKMWIIAIRSREYLRNFNGLSF